MKRISFRKTLIYDPSFEGQFSKYRGYSFITRQDRCPGILGKSYRGPRFKVDTPVFSSTVKRGCETARVLANIDSKSIYRTCFLNEIKFDLTKLLTEQEYEKQGSSLVRKRFIEAFINDELLEKRKSIEKRVKLFLLKLDSLPKGRYLVISHSFYMKIFQIYLNEKDLFFDPGKLRECFDYQQRTFDFGKGFDFRM